MNKSLKDFLLLSLLSVCVMLAVAVSLGYVYRFSSVKVYEMAIIIIILLITIITMALLMSTVVVFHAYKTKQVNKSLVPFFKAGLQLLLPVITFLAELLRYGRDDIRKFYVEVNNIIVESISKRYKPEKVLVLLPHCLQNSSCGYKITTDIKNCRKCGRCCIGDILKVVESSGVKAVVATGGTLARSFIAEAKPEFILAVACERDLTSGISDIGNLPVLGIVNERPKGPCHDTTVSVEKLKDKLEQILDRT